MTRMCKVTINLIHMQTIFLKGALSPSHFLILHFIVETEQQGLLCGKLSHRPDFSINFSLFFLSALNSNCMRSNLMKNIPLSIFPSLDLMMYFFIGFHFFLQSQDRYSKIYLLPLHNQIQFFWISFLVPRCNRNLNNLYN